MDSDRQLLRQFTQHNSQEAFAALTARYLSLVYSTCRRELGDADLAEDVTQAVFLILARKAPSLRREVVLSGWLFQTARFAARNARTQETRRKAYEQKAADTLREQQMETEDAWTDIEPLLNQSLAGLRDAERECVLLRFFQGMSFAEAGAALGLSEDAARKRVTRSLEKMRQFFVKNGVIVPSAALTVLLTTHAAKAAPIGLAPAIAKSTAGVLAGHTATAALTGSHAYQLSEGVMKAMKIVQVKIAVGITTSAVIGFGFYAASRAMTVAAPHHPASLLLTVPKPGHVLQAVPGGTLTAGQIAERCRATYASLTTYQGTSTVNDQTILGGTPHDYQATASIQFVRPGKISAQGTDMSGHPFSYVSDGVTTEQTYPTLVDWGHRWQKVSGDEKTSSTEAAIAGVTGTAAWAATTVPALLIGETWGYALPLTPRGVLDRDVREDAVDGQSCYVLTAHSATIQPVNKTETGSLWIDERTFLVRRYVLEGEVVTQAVVIGGHSIPATTIKSRLDQRFTNERLNQPIPDSTFALPPVQ